MSKENTDINVPEGTEDGQDERQKAMMSDLIGDSIDTLVKPDIPLVEKTEAEIEAELALPPAIGVKKEAPGDPVVVKAEPELTVGKAEPDVASMITALQEEIAALKAASAPKPQALPEEKAEEPVIPTAEDIDFLKDVDPEKLADPVEFNKILQRVYNSAREDVIRSIPELVARTTSRRIAYEQAISSFWADNGDLRTHEDYLAYTANKVNSEHPDWPITQILTETSERVRKELGVQKQAEQRESERKPALQAKAPKGERRGDGGREQLSELQRQLQELM